MDKKFITRLIAISISVIIVAAIIISMINKEATLELWNGIMEILNPFIIGAGIAYLVNFLYMKIYELLNKKRTNNKNDKKLRVISLILAESSVIILIVLVIFSIIPSLIESIQSIGKTLPTALDETRHIIDNTLDKNAVLNKFVGKDFDTIQIRLEAYVDGIINDNMENISKKAMGLLGNTLTITINIILSVIVNIILLANKEKMLHDAKSLIKAIFGKYSQFVFDELWIADSKFSGFFVGKVIDSIIVGIIAFIGCLIMGVKYSGLIAFIIGIFNIIPILGPIIGAIPSVIIIFSQSPKLSLYFIVFIIILQQVDGNIIGPRCIGQSTNINSFWVLFSIALFGKLWGFVGMIIGVPLFAVIYDIISKIVAWKLNKNSVNKSTEQVEEFTGSLIDDND